MQHKVLKKYNGNKSKQFTLDEVMSYVLEPGSESEMSELEDSEDEDYVPEVAGRLEEDVELHVEREENTEASDDNEGGKAENDNNDVEHIANTNGGDADHEINDKKSSNEKRVYRWRKKEPIVFDTSLKGKELSPPPEIAAEITPLQYFKLFRDDNILEHIANHTNLYNVQQSGKSLKRNAKETEVFFGIQMNMAIVKMSQCKMYWSPEFRYKRVAMAMTLKQYDTLRKFLHANANDSRNNPENSNNKLFEVGPLLDLARNNCIKIEPEKRQTEKNSQVGVQEYGQSRSIWDRVHFFFMYG